MIINILYDKSNKLKIYKQSIYIKFVYNANIVNIIRNSFTEKYYHYDKKDKYYQYWELPYNVLDKLKEVLNKYSNINITYNITGTPLDKENKIVKLKHYKLPKEIITKPYKYQKEDIDYLTSIDKSLLLSEMGLGKSLVTIYSSLIRKKENKIKHCLIIVCRSSLIWNYKDEIKTHTGLNSTVLGLRKNRNNKYVIKSNKDKLEDLQKIDDKEFFIITNIHSLQNKDIVKKLQYWIKKKEIEMIIVDEVHLCTNPNAIMTKALLKLNTKYKIAMTGTLITNNPLNVYVPLKFIGRIDTNYYSFKNHFCNFGMFNNIESYKNLNEIKDLVDSVSIRRLKKDILELPPKIIRKEYIELTDKQQKVYNNITKDIIDNLDKIENIPTMLSQLTRLRQATETTELLSTNVLESSKIERTKELLEQIDGKVVIFSVFSTTCDILYRELSKKYNCAILTGTTKNKNEQIEKFKKDESCKVFITTIGAGGVGLNLQEAHTEIFFSVGWTYAGFTQAIDRCYRATTTEKLTVYVLVAHNTIDEHILDIVNKKKSIQDGLIDNNISIASLTKMLMA